MQHEIRCDVTADVHFHSMHISQRDLQRRRMIRFGRFSGQDHKHRLLSDWIVAAISLA